MNIRANTEELKKRNKKNYNNNLKKEGGLKNKNIHANTGKT